MISRWTSAVGRSGACSSSFGARCSAIAINFASPEYFWLGIMGVFVCGSFSSPEMPVRGWIGGLIGLLIAFVGIEDIHAAPRFTFGRAELFSGVELISAMMGFFGVPSIIGALQQGAVSRRETRANQASDLALSERESTTSSAGR